MSRAVTLAGYVVIVGAIVAYQVAGLIWRRTPTLGRALATVLSRWRSARWLVLAGWLWLGWHLFVRSTH